MHINDPARTIWEDPLGWRHGWRALRWYRRHFIWHAIHVHGYFAHFSNGISCSRWQLQSLTFISRPVFNIHCSRFSLPIPKFQYTSSWRCADRGVMRTSPYARPLTFVLGFYGMCLQDKKGISEFLNQSADVERGADDIVITEENLKMGNSFTSGWEYRARLAMCF